MGRLMLGSALDGLLERVGHPTTVVVSDRYPPRSYGGAEQSLHIQLRSLGLEEDLLVVTFDDHALHPALEGVDGVRVLTLPRQGAWPYHRSPRAWPRRLGSAARGVPWLGGLLEKAAAPPVESRAEHDLMARIGVARPRGGPVADFIEVPGGLGATLLARVLRSVRPSIVHADNYRSILVVAEAARGLAMKRVGVVRDNRFHCPRHDQSLRIGNTNCSVCKFECSEADLPEHPALQRAMLERALQYRRAALEAMDRIVVTSRYLESALSPFLGEGRVVRIPNAADDLDSADLLMAGVPELPGTNVLVVGMLNENKGQLELVRWLERLVSRVPDLILHFVGRGVRVERQLRVLASDMGLSSRVELHGYVGRARLYELYRECQLVALPTLWPEPFGRVPLESGLAYRPVVSFAVGGLAESVLDGESGILVRPGDMPAFIDAVVRLANDGVLRRRLGKAARRHVLANYGVAKARDALLETWQSVLGAT